MLKLRQLEYVVALSEARSFAKAAEQTNVSQPTLSQQIKALEDHLGIILFERSTVGALPTPIGRDVVERARGILREVRDLDHAFRKAGSKLTGTIALGTTPTLGPYLLSPAIAELHKLLPELRVHVREGIPSNQAEDLAKGNLDLYLGPLPISDSSLEIEPLFREPLNLVVAKDHVLTSYAVVEPSALHGLSLLSIDPKHHYHRQLASIAEEYGMRLASNYEGTSLDSLHQMASTGLGVTVLPELYIASDVGGLAGLKVIPVKEWNHYRSICLAWRRSSALGDQFRMIGNRIASAARDVMNGRRDAQPGS